MAEVERTLAIVKPDAVEKGATGEILRRIEAAGLRIVALKMARLTEAQAQGFYAVHRERPFYSSLVRFMTSGPVVLAALEGPDAIARWRRLMGATDPANAEGGQHPPRPRVQRRAQRHPRLGRARDGPDRARLLLQRDRGPGPCGRPAVGGVQVRAGPVGSPARVPRRRGVACAALASGAGRRPR